MRLLAPILYEDTTSYYIRRRIVSIRIAPVNSKIVDGSCHLNWEKHETDNKENHLASLLLKCGSYKYLSQGKQIHEYIVKSGLAHQRFLCNCLALMYGKCGALCEARAVFDNMKKRNTFSWNIMIKNYAQNGDMDEALKLFMQMPKKDVVSWNAMVGAYAQQGRIEDALQFFQAMPQRDVVSWTSMIWAYALQGNLEEAFLLFEKMPRRDLIAWNAMMAAYAQQGSLQKAICLFNKMLLEGMAPDKFSFISILDECANQGALTMGKEFHIQIMENKESDIAVGNALIHMYGKCGYLQDAHMVFDKMPERGVLSWNALISAYGQNGYGRELFLILRQMTLEGVKPTYVTFLSILSGCNHAGLMMDGYYCLICMSSEYNISPTLEHFNCIVNLLSRIGHLDIGEVLINHMPFHPDDTTWAGLLGSCRIHCDFTRGRFAAGNIVNTGASMWL